MVDIPNHVLEAKPSEFDYLLGNIPYTVHCGKVIFDTREQRV